METFRKFIKFIKEIIKDTRVISTVGPIVLSLCIYKYNILKSYIEYILIFDVMPLLWFSINAYNMLKTAESKCIESLYYRCYIIGFALLFMGGAMVLNSLFIYLYDREFATFYGQIGVQMILVGLSVAGPAILELRRNQECHKSQTEKNMSQA